jgi:HD-like signal output (HDOD) protein
MAVDPQAVERIVARVGELPAMPAVVSEVLRISNDPAADMTQLSHTIQGDPALTAKVLRVANSPYYGMRQYVGTLKLALVILGVREVRNIVLGISVFETLKTEKDSIDIARKIWERSLVVAGLAKKLGQSVGLGLQGEEFIAGLLSDIGKMVLLRQLGAPYREMLEKGEQDPGQLCHLELEEVGCTHADLAMALAVNWNLPQALSDALWRQYPDPERPLGEAAHPGLTAVLRLAKTASVDDLSSLETSRTLQDAEAWKVLSKTKNPIADEMRLETLVRYLEELKEAAKASLWLW